VTPTAQRGHVIGVARVAVSVGRFGGMKDGHPNPTMTIENDPK